MYYLSSTRSGFTIVELLIVIVIIGILAGLVITTFVGTQNKAYDTSVRSDVKNVGTKLEAYNATEGYYPTNAADLTAAKFKVNKSAVSTAINNTALYCRADGKFAVLMQSRSGKAYIQTHSEGVKELTTTWSESSGTACPNAGIATTDAGYAAVWLRANGNWVTWLP